MKRQTMCVATAATMLASGSALGQGFADGFDTYVTNAPIAGQGAWVRWIDFFTGLAGLDGDITGTQWVSPPNSMRLRAFSDIVRPVGNVTSGKWVLSMRVLIASSSNTQTRLALLNRYQPSTPAGMDGNYLWSVQVEFSADAVQPPAGRVIDQLDPQGPSPALVFDAWTTVRIEIDLDNDRVSKYYNGQLIGRAEQPWREGGAIPGFGTAEPQLALEAISVFANVPNILTPYGALFDDVRLEQVSSFGCYPNCDGSTTAPTLNALDFQCFVSRYRAQDPYANCDGSVTPPVLNALDFTCFLNRFRQGCTP